MYIYPPILGGGRITYTLKVSTLPRNLVSKISYIDSVKVLRLKGNFLSSTYLSRLEFAKLEQYNSYI